ncbi:MAG: DUF2953 domain-containing protein [Lachnospiraceae bacterium]|nr:DUF2953 domain-containing protein [Lachnospiraceae bacterium]
MAILLTILKVIGIIVLVLLGIALLLILLALFLPVKYCARASLKELYKHADGSFTMKEQLPYLKVKGVASWLFHFFGIFFFYENQETDYGFRILFFKKHLATEEKDPVEDEHFTFVKEEPQEDLPKIEHPVQKEMSTKIPDTTTKQTSSKRPKERKKKKEKTEKSTHGIFEVLSSVYVTLNKEENKDAFQLVKHELQYLCKHFGPRKLVGELNFSLSDPCYTGLLLGFISLFPLSYHKNYKIVPDFITEQLYVYGDMEFKGRIRLIHVVIAGFHLYKNPVIKKLWKSWR